MALSQPKGCVYSTDYRYNTIKEHKIKMTRPGRYTGIAMTLHWLLAVLIIGSFSFGIYMTGLPFSPARVKQFNWHKWAGMTILFLSALRLLWRLSHKPPAPAATTAPWQTAAAGATHWLLYLLFFAVPLMGWAYSSAAGFPIVYLGLIPLPDFVSPDPDVAKVLKTLHHYLAYSLAALVLLHIAAAVKHQWVDRDGLLLRMMPGKSR
jgi:cytochrome b561